MKRGPSKGYIKELAERLNTLERQVHPGAQGDGLRGEIQRVQREMAAAQALEGMPDPRAGDKRAHAVAEMLHTPGGSASSPAGWGQQSSPISPNPYFTPQQQQQPPPPGGMQPFWRHGGNENRQEHTVCIPTDTRFLLRPEAGDPTARAALCLTKYQLLWDTY